MEPFLQIFDDSVRSFINADAEMQTLASDCRFTEGPVWNEAGFYLFSDITANTVYRLVPGHKKEVFIAQSGTDSPQNDDLNPDQAGSNGLAYDRDSTLLVCRHGSHEVARWNGTRFEPFLQKFEAHPFNSPNDLVVHKNGSVFFSDPPYGLKEGKPNPETFQPLAAVYRYRNGELEIVCDKYQYPNGVCLTPDEKELYICSNKPFEKFVSVYDAETLAFKRTLAEENSDGIKCDPQGNVYLCSKEGIVVLNSEGKRMALLSFSTIPANCCFGGEGKKDLLVCARENVFLVRGLLR